MSWLVLNLESFIVGKWCTLEKACFQKLINLVFPGDIMDIVSWAMVPPTKAVFQP